MIETLTDEERVALRSQREWPDLEDIEKALRIIDDNAADRAALVAQRDAAEREIRSSHRVSENLLRERDALVAQVAELTRERDEARKKAEFNCKARLESDRQVAELERDRDEWKTQHENLLAMYQRRVAEVAALKTEWAEHDGVPILEREVTRLTEALAAAEQTARNTLDTNASLVHAFEAAEAQAQRGHQLAAEWKATAEAYRVDAEVARDRLASANALLEQVRIQVPLNALCAFEPSTDDQATNAGRFKVALYILRQVHAIVFDSEVRHLAVQTAALQARAECTRREAKK